VLSFQALSTIVTTVILVILILPKVRVELIHQFTNQRPLFWKLYFANGIQAGIGACLALLGIAITDTINAGYLVKLTMVTTILFTWIILEERLTALKVVIVFFMSLGAYLLTTKDQVLIPKTADIFFLEREYAGLLGPSWYGNS